MNPRNEPVDVVIVGAGAAGGVLARDLAKAGLSVVLIEAGPYYDPQRDYVSDELTMGCKLAWTQLRLVDGKDPIKLGQNNSGRGVGGGTNHFTGVMLRFHESDFRTRTLDGVGEDWPISYWDLEPYYDRIEKEIGVSGPRNFPWGPFRGPYPYPERVPLSATAQLFMEGCEKLGITSSVAPLAILSAPKDGRPPCTNRGFCNQGCIPNAKFSTLITYIRQAAEEGCTILPDSFVTRILTNGEGEVTGVEYRRDGKDYRQKASVVVMSAFVVENARLLLNSAEGGLANSSGTVGQYIMPHISHDVYGRFDVEVLPYKGTPVLATTLDFYETDLKRYFARGYCIHAHGFRPVAFARQIAPHYLLWGEKFRKLLMDYNYFARLTLVGEVLPYLGNRVTLDPNIKDDYGLPVPRVTFSYGENEMKMIEHGVGKCKEILKAAGAGDLYVVPDTAHLMGGCRMGKDPKTSVVDEFCRSHDIKNLFICDASVFVTSSGANPTETVMALAARTADYLIECFRKAEFGEVRV